MSFGYLIIISESDSYDYLKMAYALAISIKNTQKPGYDKVALVTDNPTQVQENCKSPWVFDHVIHWDQETFWDGRTWMDRLSPFDETICLDADMLFFEDYSHWVDSLRGCFDVFLPSKSYTYRNEVITNDFYRKAFTKNNLPNLYSFYTFFKKDSSITTEFFSLSRYITKHPKEFTNLFLEKFKPSIIGTDEAFSLSAKILGIDSYITADLEFPKIVHMKSEVQNWPWSAKEVTDHAGFYLGTDGNLKIGNYSQKNIVHYVEKDLATDEMVSIMENVLWKK
jgi:hypothetical protein